MAKTNSSRKAKGSRLEKEIAKRYSKRLYPKSTRMPMSGAMAFHKGDILKRDDKGRVVYDVWLDECKNQEKVKLWEWWEQTIEQCGAYQKPVLHIKRNYSEGLTVMRTEDYFELRETIVCLEKSLREQDGKN